MSWISQVEFKNVKGLELSMALPDAPIVRVWGGSYTFKTRFVESLLLVYGNMLGSLPNRGMVEDFQQDLLLRIWGESVSQESSSFFFGFVRDGVGYEYSFTFEDGRVLREELLQLGERRGKPHKSPIFQREGDVLKGKPRVKASKTWFAMTRKDVLFLSAHVDTRDLFPRMRYVLRDVETAVQQRDVVFGLDHGYFVGSALQRCQGLVIELDKDPSQKQKVVSLLQRLDDRVVGVERGCVQMKHGSILGRDLPRAMKELLVLSERLFIVLARGGYWVIDDWDCYSEKVCRVVESMFLDVNENPLGARLLYTCSKDVCFSKETRDAKYEYSDSSLEEKSSLTDKVVSALKNVCTKLQAMPEDKFKSKLASHKDAEFTTAYVGTARFLEGKQAEEE